MTQAESVVTLMPSPDWSRDDERRRHHAIGERSNDQPKLRLDAVIAVNCSLGSLRIALA